jgi:sugar lactone lactonase YvrE
LCNHSFFRLLDILSSFSVGYGITVAGNCDESTISNQAVITMPTDIALAPNGTLYAANDDGRILAFVPNQRTALTVTTFTNIPTCILFDNRTSELYVGVNGNHLVYILPGNRTIPPDGRSLGLCILSRLHGPIGLAIDSMGNVYISCALCNQITKWAPNATAGILIAGSSSGSAGTTGIHLSRPYGLILDEYKSVIYVADRFNHRVQRFPLDGSGVGITVAGDTTASSAANRLNRPTEIYLSKLGDFIYICDSFNHRVQKWPMNGTFGITVAGDPNGSFGRTFNLLNVPLAMAVDPNEQFLYVSDSHNNRVQRFSFQ